MSEVAEAPVQVSAEQQTNQEVANVKVDPFGQGAWAETVPEVKKEEAVVATEVKTEQVQAAVNTPAENEEILDPKDWVKREFEVDDPEILKQQIKEYRELKSKPQAEEQKWDNEESKVINELLRTGKKKEVLQILALQDKLENLVSSEVNEDNAAEIIKTGLRLKHKDLTDREIDYKYNKQYSLPKEPALDPDDDESVEKHNAWKEQVEDIKMSKIIDAKTMKPDLEKAKVELKFPELEKPTATQANEQDPEVMKKVKESLINKLEGEYKKIEGFETRVKDESVDIPVSFKIPDEDKATVKSILEKDFEGESNFIYQRWFDEKGEPKIEQMMSDLYLLTHTDKVMSGIANNAANQRLLEARKQATNSDIKNQVHQNTFQPNADGKANISPFAKEAWSEKPVAHY